MDHLQASLSTIHRLLSTLVKQVSELEHRVCSNEDNISDLEYCVQKLEKENSHVKEIVLKSLLLKCVP